MDPVLGVLAKQAPSAVFEATAPLHPMFRGGIRLKVESVSTSELVAIACWCALLGASLQVVNADGAVVAQWPPG